MPDNIFPPQNRDKIEYFSGLGYYRDETLLSWLEYSAGSFGDEAAVIFSGTTLSYRELYQQVSRFASGLQSLGLGKNDIVAVQLPNIPEFIVSYLAIAAIGGIMQTLHMPYQLSELNYLIEDSGASAVICLGQFKTISPADTFLKIARTNEKLKNIISLGDIIDGSLDFHALNSGPVIPLSSEIGPNDLFVLLYTSGTTSAPKGVPHRYNNFLSNARLCCEEYAFTHTDRLLSVAPMTHLYGLFTYNMTLSVSASTILLPAFNPDAFVEVVRRCRPSAIFAAPAHFSTCFKEGLLHPEDFSSVKFVCLSGSTVAPGLANRVDDLLLNGVVGQLWGMSELQAGAITRRSDSKDTRCHYSGRSTIGTELRIVDDKNQPQAAGSDGELQVRGLSVFDGYLNRPEDTALAFTEDGWFRTGDLASINTQGELKIIGRTKNLINRGGVKYNPLEIEALVGALKAVDQCAIIPKKDEVYGESACIFVVVNDGMTITLEEIRAALDKQNIAKYKWPEHLRLIDSMPMTPTNKIKLEELALQLDLA